MRNRSLILLTAVLVIVFVGVAGVYAYDRGGRGTIAEGVSIAGVDVGGMNGEQARAALENGYVAQLRKPITIAYGTQTFSLDASEKKAAANIATLVDQALAQGRGDSILTRSWRRLTGRQLDVDVAPSTFYDREAVTRLLAEIRTAIDRPSQNAGVEFSSTGMIEKFGRDGLQVRTATLASRLEHAIVDPRAARSFEVPVTRSEPTVTTADVAAKYKTALIVNRQKFTLTLYEKLEKVKTYRIAVGALGLETPAGLYQIQNKAINPAWTKPHSDWVKPSERGDVVPGGTPQNPLKARWMGIFDGAGIHGIDPSEYGSIGHAASHGCVRMRIPDVIDLYSKVPVGTPIYIG
jgi:lipoprotein-anchoring transpeptidase ErfK/SrfK